MSDDQRAADAAHAFLRSHYAGELRFEEHLRPLKYVAEPRGRLVAPVMYAMLDAVDTVLFVPAFAEGAMEVMVTLIEFDPQGAAGAAADRWRIYHGEPPDVHWARLEIDAARHEGWVVDGEGLMRANPLAPDEARLCRSINERWADGIGPACRRYAGADVEAPLVVGVDPQGFDVRRRFDVVRLPAPRPMESADQVQETIRALVEAGAEGPGG